MKHLFQETIQLVKLSGVMKTHHDYSLSCLSLSFFRNKTAVLTDSRIRTMNEVVSGIRIIKMYAWEKPFTALINDIRK